MLKNIAWRNIWRNKTRSLTVILAIIVGIWAGVTTMAISYGLNEPRIKNTIDVESSHMQLHPAQFLQDKDISMTFSDVSTLLETLSAHPEIKAVTPRMRINGMVTSPTNGQGATIYGIDTTAEKTVSTLSTMVKEGAYLSGIKRNPVLIGQKLAEKLKVKVRSKIVLTFQDPNKEIVSGAFRIAGIYKTSNPVFDEGNVYVMHKDLAKLSGQTTEDVHEIAVLFNNIDASVGVTASLKNELPKNIQVQDWKEVAPEVGYSSAALEQGMYIFISIIMIALAFGILNTMLMAVLERTREIGMLLSVGMNKSRVFGMIVLETIFLAISSMPIGILLGFITIQILSKTGIDLSIVGEGLNSFGMSTMVYPVLEGRVYGIMGVMVVITATLSSLYPAWKALRLNPVEAIRKV